MQYIGPVKCSLEYNPQIDEFTNTLKYEDNSLVSKNEIDIGQDDWSFKIPNELSLLKWRFANYTPDYNHRYYLKRTFNAVFRAISLIIPKKIQYTTNESESFFNIVFTKDLDVFGGGPTNTIAQAYLYHPNNSKYYNGRSEWNDNYFFTPFGDKLPAYLVDPEHYTEGEKWNNGELKKLDTIPLGHVGLHEICHNFGFHHDLNSRESVMYPYAQDGYNRDGTINQDAFIYSPEDVARWQLAYGKRKLSWWSRYNLERRRIRGRKVSEVPYLVLT